TGLAPLFEEGDQHRRRLAHEARQLDSRGRTRDRHHRAPPSDHVPDLVKSDAPSALRRNGGPPRGRAGPRRNRAGNALAAAALCFSAPCLVGQTVGVHSGVVSPAPSPLAGSPLAASPLAAANRSSTSRIPL